jgi:hypothetical protein
MGHLPDAGPEQLIDDHPCGFGRCSDSKPLSDVDQTFTFESE